MKIAVAAVAVLVWQSAYAQTVRDTPDPELTTGATAVVSTDEGEVCGIVGGKTYSQRHRLSQKPETKRAVFARYIAKYGTGGYQDPSRFEDDHSCPLSLGCSDDITNRWPQPRFGAWTSALKDKLETRAWEMVCKEHSLSLAGGQALFLPPATVDWRQSYCKVIGGAPCPVK